MLEGLDLVQELVRDEAGHELAEPWAQLEADAIRLGFGEKELEPIRLDALAG